MVDGATGYLVEDKERMVKTPWLTQEIPFSKAGTWNSKGYFRTFNYRDCHNYRWKLYRYSG